MYLVALAACTTSIMYRVSVSVMRDREDLLWREAGTRVADSTEGKKQARWWKRNLLYEYEGF